MRHESVGESEHGGPLPPPVLRGRPPVDTPLDDDEGGLFGVVLHAATGATVEGVHVHAVRLDHYHGDRRLLGSSVSDTKGRYRIRELDRHYLPTTVIALGGGFASDVDWSLDWGRGDRLPVRLRAQVVEGSWVAHDVRVRPALQVEGTVSLPDGAPAVGASVCPGPNRMRHHFPWHLLPPTTTDARGHYLLDAAPAAKGLGVEARLEGTMPVLVDGVEVTPGTRTTIDLRLLPSHRATIEVMDATNSTPLEGAEVGLEGLRYGREDGGLEEAYAKTDADGRATFASVPHGGFHLAVAHEACVDFRPGEAESWGRNVTSQTSPGTWTGRVALTPYVTIEGVVEWPGGMHPIPTAYIECSRTDGFEADGEGFLELRSDQTFRRATAPEGTWRLILRAYAGGREWFADAEVEPGAKGVVLRPGIVRVSEAEDRSGWGHWRLTICDETDAPIESALVESHGPARMEILTRAPRKGLPEGLLEVRVAPGDESGFLTLLYAETCQGRFLGRLVVGPLGSEGGERDVAFPAPRTIRGCVLDADGRPLQGVQVTAVPFVSDEISYLHPDPPAFTDADGRFVLTSLLQATYDVVVQPCGPRVLPPAQRVAAGCDDLVFTLGKTTTCRVSVRDAGGVALPRAWLWLLQVDGARGPDAEYDGIEACTGEDGQALVEGLDPEGVYELHARPPEGRRDLLRWIDRTWAPQDQEIALAPAFEVAGLVLDPGDDPLAGIEVWLEHPGGRRVTARADGEGCFGFVGIAAGRVRLGVHFPEMHPDGWEPVWTHETAAGDREVVLRIDPGRELVVHVEAPDDEWLEMRTLDLTPAENGVPGTPKRIGLSARGVARFRGLEPGVRYRLWGGPTPEERYVLAKVGPGDTAVRTSYRKGGRIEGRVLLPADAKRRGVKIVKRGVHCHASVFPDGTFRLEGVPPGDWLLEAWCRVNGVRRAARRTARVGESPVFDLNAP